MGTGANWLFEIVGSRPSGYLMKEYDELLCNSSYSSTFGSYFVDLQLFFNKTGPVLCSQVGIDSPLGNRRGSLNNLLWSVALVLKRTECRAIGTECSQLVT